MENNNNYNNYDLPKSIQLEESANNNTQNNNFFNNIFNNFENINNTDNFIETVSNISDEKKAQVLNNNINDNSMLGKKIKKTNTKNNNFNNFTKSVQKTIQLKEPEKQEKLNKLEEMLKNPFLKDFSKYLINQLENKSLTEDKSKINYLDYRRSNLYVFVKNFRVSLINTCKLKIENVPATLKEMLNALKTFYNVCGYLGFVNKEGEITNDDAQTYIETLKNQINLYKDYLNSNKNNELNKLEKMLKNPFLKDFSIYLINQLKNKSLISLIEDKSKINYLAYSHSNLYMFVRYFRTLLINTYKLKIEDIPAILEEMLNALKTFYNVCGYLGFVNKEGEITNDDAQTYIETLQNQINLYKNYLNSNEKNNKTFEEYLNSNKYKTSERNKITRKKNKKEKISEKKRKPKKKNIKKDVVKKIYFNTFTKSGQKPIQLKEPEKQEILNKLKEMLKNHFLKDFSKYLINQLENKSLTEDDSKINYLTYCYSKLYMFAMNFKNLLKKNYKVEIKDVSETLEEMLNALNIFYNACGYLGFANAKGEITDKTAQTYFNTLKNQINLFIDYLNSDKKVSDKEVSFEKYLNSNKYKTSERNKITRKKNKKEEIIKNNNFNNSPKSNPIEKPLDLSLQNLNFLNNATKNETAKPNENEINENNIFNINFNLYELNQPKEQEEQKYLEELEEDSNSSSQNFFFGNNL